MDFGKFKILLDNNRFIVLLFLVSFFIHFAASIFLYYKFGDNVLFFENEDAHSYVNTAYRLVEGKGFAHNGLPSPARTPMYPLFLAIPLVLHLPFVWTVLIMQNLIVFFSGFFIYKIGKDLFSERAGKIAAWLYVLEPYMLMTSNLGTTETFFNFLVICFFYFFYRFYLRSTSKSDLAISGLLLGLCVLTRPIALYLAVLVFILLSVRFFFVRQTMKQFILYLALFFFIFISVLFPWMWRQHNLFGFWRITTIDAGMLYFRTGSIVVSDKENVSNAKAIEILKDKLRDKFPDYDDEKLYNSFEYYSFMTTEATKLIKSDPNAILKTFSVSLIPAFFGSGYDYIIDELTNFHRNSDRISYSKLLLDEGFSGIKKIFSQFDVPFVAMLFGVGIWGILYLLIFYTLMFKDVWKQHALSVILLILMIAYFIFVALGISMHARYRVPSFPFIFLLSGLAIDFLWKKYILYKEKKREIKDLINV